MLITTPAIVISSVKFGEADLIVKCLTKAEGLKSYILKGILKSKKGKFRTAYFQPLTLLDISSNHKNKGTLEYLLDAKVSRPYNTLHNQVVKSSLVLFLSEVLKQCIVEEEKNEKLFDFLVKSFHWLDGNEQIANFHLLFLLKLSDFLGFYPDESTLKLPVFNLMDGIFQNEVTNIYCVETNSENPLFKRLFGINFDALKDLKPTKKEREACLQLLLLYFQLHLQGFKPPKSLSVLNQIFN
jgi:DNA repair protein RecO (recombination protein O)